MGLYLKIVAVETLETIKQEGAQVFEFSTS